jgi:hypothetical protein
MTDSTRVGLAAHIAVHYAYEPPKTEHPSRNRPRPRPAEARHPGPRLLHARDPISPAAYKLWRQVGGAPPVAPSLGPKQTPSEEKKGGVTEADAERLLRQALGRVFGDLASTLGKQIPEGNQASCGAPPAKPQE